MENEADGSRERGARRDDETAGRRPWELRVHSPLTEAQERIVTRIIDCAFMVHRTLGPGFKEVIYERAMCLEMDAVGLKFETQKKIEVRYKHWRIPGQRIDLLLEDFVLVEIKALPRLRKIHESQAFSYLKTLDLHIALLMNFKAPVLKQGLKRVVR